jgi:hypothetical protein
MKTATVYVAVDGRQFNEAAKARDYEEGLFTAWLRDNAIWKDFFHAAGLPEDKQKRREVVRDFWEWNFSK